MYLIQLVVFTGTVVFFWFQFLTDLVFCS